MSYKKMIYVTVDSEHAATITVDVEDKYATEIGTTSEIGDELDKFLTELIKKNSLQKSLQ